MERETAERVLIADADPGVRRQIYKRLLDGGIFADAVPDGASAIERLGTRPYAVVLLDLGLPGGAERVLEFLSLNPGSGRPVILVLSDGPVMCSLDVDLVQIVLRKPCNLTQLADLVSSCVRTATLRRGEGATAHQRDRQPGESRSGTGEPRLT